MEIILKNSEVVATINTLGAELVSFKDIKAEKEFMWQGEVWKKTSPVLFPVIGGLVDGEFIYEGKSYAMPKHGFAQLKEFSFISESENCVRFFLKSSQDTLKIYPFEFEFSIVYTLEAKKLNIEYRVENLSDKEMIFSVGGHPGFACPLDEKRKIDGYYIEFEVAESAERFPVEGMFISKKSVPALKNSQKLFLSETIFNQDAWIFQNLKSEHVTLKNIYDASEVKVGVKGFEYLAFWAKPGAAYVCVEPWCGIADFVGHDKCFANKQGNLFLEGGKTFSIHMPIEVK